MSARVLSIAEHKNGKLSHISYELISVAKKIGGELMTAVMAENASDMANDLAAHGGGKVLSVSNAGFKYFNDSAYCKAVTELISKHQPTLVLVPATFYGKALGGRLAAANGAAMVSDITGITADGDNVVLTRPSYGGNVIANITGTSGKLTIASIRPKVFDESKEGAGEVVEESVSEAVFDVKSAIKDIVVESGQSVNLTEADVIVSVGRGIRGPENLALIENLAKAVGGAVGASRAIVDAGWIQYRHQIGQTGKTVNPKLYFALGISGAIQHLVGMQTSRTIVAVNRDKDAPIFKIASYGIVGDLFEIVPALTKKFESANA